MKLSVMSGDMQIEEDVIYRGTYIHTCMHTYIHILLARSHRVFQRQCYNNNN